jgi:hypothetical protein
MIRSKQHVSKGDVFFFFGHIFSPVISAYFLQMAHGITYGWIPYLGSAV